MLIDIIVHADFLCPWCYLEKRSLETAMYKYKARHPEVDFRVVWKPYLLYPTIRKVDKRTLYTNIMSPEKLDSFINGVQTAGSRHGIAFAVHGQTGPSQSSHRLAALTLRTLGPLAQAAVVEALFRGHFERGMDVSDGTWLVAVGRSVGLQEKDVLKVLRCEDMGRELEREVRGAMSSGVVAVPSVLVGGRFRVGGYQNADLFEGVFDSYVKEQSEGRSAAATTTTTTVEGTPDSDWLRVVTARAARER
ncbi:thioredoxin-like protein [Thelonectria olida]|uniref:Thioredoxin-like protein n=1 Tax=Thelonectria olida TaxID=1576542 RepID=A0A9P8WCT4_9HYPO|nr:thioredoxin-like protein [Thelonectria olida]